MCVSINVVIFICDYDESKYTDNNYLRLFTTMLYIYVLNIHVYKSVYSFNIFIVNSILLV